MYFGLIWNWSACHESMGFLDCELLIHSVVSMQQNKLMCFGRGSLRNAGTTPRLGVRYGFGVFAPTQECVQSSQVIYARSKDGVTCK